MDVKSYFDNKRRLKNKICTEAVVISKIGTFTPVDTSKPLCNVCSETNSI